MPARNTHCKQRPDKTFKRNDWSCGFISINRKLVYTFSSPGYPHQASLKFHLLLHRCQGSIFTANLWRLATPPYNNLDKYRPPLHRHITIITPDKKKMLQNIKYRLSKWTMQSMITYNCIPRLKWYITSEDKLSMIILMGILMKMGIL